MPDSEFQDLAGQFLKCMAGMRRESRVYPNIHQNILSTERDLDDVLLTAQQYLRPPSLQLSHSGIALRPDFPIIAANWKALTARKNQIQHWIIQGITS